MMLEIAIGDAYGASFEFAPKRFVSKHNTALLYVRHHSRDILPGHYTDDTQMSLAIVEMILDSVEFTPLSVADKFVEVFKRDPREGYGSIYGLLNDKNIKTGIALMRRIMPYSKKNGSVMRSVPLGIIKDPHEVASCAAIQSMVTHCHPDAIVCSQFIALASHWAIYYSTGMLDMRELFAFANIYINVPDILLRLYSEPSVPCDAVKTTHAVCTILEKSKSYAQILKNSCNMLGDTDSVAAVAMGLASVMKYKLVMSPQLVNGLENSNYGLGYLTLIDKKIIEYIKE